MSGTVGTVGTVVGEVILMNGRIIAFKLSPQEFLEIDGAGEDPSEIYHSDQVVRMIDYDLGNVSKFRINGGAWIKYR